MIKMNLQILYLRGDLLMVQCKEFTPPSTGEKITVQNGVINTPNNPIIPFIEGDGTGPDIWAAAQRVLDTAVEKAYAGEKKIAWYEVYAGEKAFNKFNSWLPEDTLEAIREYRSEEHTSELQSRENIVCRLLLEKKNKE